MTSAVVVAITLTTVLILVMSPLAQKIGLVDHPNARKAHTNEIPLVGGLGIFLSFFVATYIFVPILSPTVVFFVASTVVVLGGLLDDFLDVSPLAKLLFQIIAVLLMCLAGGVSVQTVGELVPTLGPINMGVFAIPFTLIAAIGAINAVNLSDGLDGLAGFQLAIAFVALAFLAERAGAGAYVGELLLLIACVSAFLFFNARVFGRKKASVFLGDAGTMFLGFAYVWFAIDLSNGSDAIMSPVTALWLLAVPICDAVTMMIRRVSRGRSPFKADKEHLHHVLLMAGFTVGETVMVLTGMAAIGAAIGVAGEVFALPDASMLFLFLVTAALYLFVILRSWMVMRFLRWSICRRRTAVDRRGHTEQRRAQRGLPGGVERRSGSDRRVTADRRARQAQPGSATPEVARLVPREQSPSLLRGSEPAASMGSGDDFSGEGSLPRRQQR